MNLKLSRTEISSFCGNVLPLKLTADADLSQAPIRWSCDDESVLSVKTFAGEENESFNDGVLLTLKRPGRAVVTAEYEGETFSCSVSVRERKEAPAGKLNFYPGDFHDHTSELHNHDRFAARETDFPIDYLNRQKEDGRLAFAVISDHAIVTNKRDFFRGFTDLELAEPMETVIFPGSESEVTFIENDRFGLSHKNSGEIVSVNTNNFSWSRDWQTYYDAMADAPFAVCVLAHPQVVGWDKNGIWNFQLHRNNNPLMKQLIKGVEMGQGWPGNMLHEHIYSVALDCGFKVSVTCSSDCHGPKWGYDAWPGKTVVMAEEKSREAILDALLSRRFYATESGNVKLWYTVNGFRAGDTLPRTDRYEYRVELDYFKEDPSTVPVKCQVISDYGAVVKTVEIHKNVFSFTVESQTARYFYLRLVDERGRKTWSAPIWTGRESDEMPQPELIPLEKAGCTAVDRSSGADASPLIANDPTILWEGENPTCDVVIDLQKEETFCAVGHYPARYLMEYFQKTGARDADKFAQFAHEYEISVSSDDQNYTPCDAGKLRVFGGEEIVTFPEQTARYVRFKILSTIGKFSGYKEFADAKVCISELTVFRKK